MRAKGLANGLEMNGGFGNPFVELLGKQLSDLREHLAQAHLQEVARLETENAQLRSELDDNGRLRALAFHPLTPGSRGAWDDGPDTTLFQAHQRRPSLGQVNAFEVTEMEDVHPPSRPASKKRTPSCKRPSPIAAAPPPDTPKPMFASGMDDIESVLDAEGIKDSTTGVPSLDHQPTSPPKDVSGGTVSASGTVSVKSILKHVKVAEDYDDEEEEDGHGFEVLQIWTATKIFKRQSRLAMNLVHGQTQDSKELAQAGSLNPTLFRFTQRIRKYMVPPSSRKHITWEICGLLLIAYDVVVIPLDFFNPPAWTFTEVMSWVVRVYWTFDIFKSFLTGFLDAKGKVVLDPQRSALRYARSWMCFDLSVVTWDWVSITQGGSIGGIFRGVRVMAIPRSMRFLRLIKVIRLAMDSDGIVGFINDHARSQLLMLVASILRSILLLLWLAHLIACFWYGIGSGGGDSWVKNHLSEDEHIGESYLWSIHWSVAQFAGELVYSPRNSTERMFAVFVFIFAFLFSTLFVSSITTSMTHLMMVANIQSSQIAALRRFIFDNDISTSLAVRVQHNAQHVLKEQRQNFSEENVELLKIISEHLRAELRFEIHSRVLLAHPFFDYYYRINAAGVRRVCDVAVSRVKICKGDIVFHDLETPSWQRMFFIISGTLQYLQRDADPRFVKDGEWLCEAVLWTNWMHCGTLQAETNCTLLVLDKEQFCYTISPFPTHHARDYAGAFVEELNRTDRDFLTDLRDNSVDVACKCAFMDLDSAPLRHSSHSMMPSQRITIGGVLNDAVNWMRPTVSGDGPLNCPGRARSGSGAGRLADMISVKKSSTTAIEHNPSDDSIATKRGLLHAGRHRQRHHSSNIHDRKQGRSNTSQSQKSTKSEDITHQISGVWKVENSVTEDTGRPSYSQAALQAAIRVTSSDGSASADDATNVASLTFGAQDNPIDRRVSDGLPGRPIEAV